MIYRYVVSDRFSADCLLDCLDLSSEHVALEIANRVEASIYIWRRRAHAHSRPPPHLNRSAVKPSWGTMVKDLMVDIDKRELLAEKAERLLLSLKQRFPGLSQTILDASKIQFNKVNKKTQFSQTSVKEAEVTLLFFMPGCWEIDHRELLESPGESCVQYRGPYRRHPVR